MKTTLATVIRVIISSGHNSKICAVIMLKVTFFICNRLSLLQFSIKKFLSRQICNGFSFTEESSKNRLPARKKPAEKVPFGRCADSTYLLCFSLLRLLILGHITKVDCITLWIFSSTNFRPPGDTQRVDDAPNKWWWLAWENSELLQKCSERTILNFF